MMAFVIFLHVLVCIFICIVILMQSGRGGGLTEHFAAAESMFGAKTNIFLVKTTTVLSILFFLTCVSLAILSAKKDRSLMSSGMAVPTKSKEATQSHPAEEIPVPSESAPAASIPAVATPETAPASTTAPAETK